MTGKISSYPSQVYDFNSQWISSNDGSYALNTFDLDALEILYADSSHQLWKFLKLEHIQNFINFKVGKGNEKDFTVLKWLFDKVGPQLPDLFFEILFDKAVGQEKMNLPLLKWLIEVARDKIPPHRYEMAFNAAAKLDMQECLPLMQLLIEKCSEKMRSCSNAFLAAAEQGKKGLPLMKWLLENIREKVDSPLYPYGDVFKSAVWKPDGLIIMQFLLDNVKQSLHHSHFEAAFKSALYNEKGFPMLQLIWENTPEKDGHIFREYVVAFQRRASEDPEIFAKTDWLLEKLFLQLGSGHHASDSAWIKLNPEGASLLDSHLKKNGYEWEKEVDASRIYCNAPFKSLFKRINAEGLSFFERVCKEMPDKVPAYGARWAFLKAAANGKQGHPLMQWLAENAGKKLSYWTYQRALHIAEKHGHAETAQWIKGQKGEASQVDDEDIKLLLATSHTPSGYRLLGDIPERYGWKQLDQEELNKIAPDSAFEGMKVEDPFAKIAIVEDSAKPTHKEIRKSEAELFRKLYVRIKMGHAHVKVDGDAEFKEMVYGLIRDMMGCPSGRWMLLFACRMKNPKPLVILNDSESSYMPNFHCLFLEKAAPSPQVTLGENGKKKTFQASKDTTLFHEMLHAVHHDENSHLTTTLGKMQPSDPAYTNLEEQRTIAGVEPECEHLGPFALSQNTYHFEKGYVKRYGHADISMIKEE